MEVGANLLAPLPGISDNHNMSDPLQLHDGDTFASLLKREKLLALDQQFFAMLAQSHPALHEDLQRYRQRETFTPLAQSTLLIAVAKELELFIAEFFSIEREFEHSQQQVNAYRQLFAFKKWIVQRRARRRLAKKEKLKDFLSLDQQLEENIAQIKLKNKMDYSASSPTEKELKIAAYADNLLKDKVINSDKIEQLTQWCIQAMKTSVGQREVKGWVSFKFPNRRDYQRLIPIVVVEEATTVDRQAHVGELSQRDGFDLTDKRMTASQVLDEVHYCLYCHDNGNDFCSKGFPEKGANETFKHNPLGNILAGCPLDEKISEMQQLKRDGHTIAALAMIMVDNPMCPATGHRICNDCMKACIYQKQDPVDTPQIETRVLTDVLDLPWGVEIYHLLARWNPLRQRQFLPKAYRGKKVLIAGMGPAGFTMAHHLLMEGFAVVGVDGLKIEPLDHALLTQPVRHYQAMTEQLSERLITGFGGVAEYGITARWDKNFLKLIYLTLMRRSYFQCFGGVRFGGGITVEQSWALGFDHLTVAVGAGLPRALPIVGSLAPGIRQANDFLMALQLTGAAKSDSLANLQLRLPAIVVGSGLTAVDTATEAQAYYIKQVEKLLWQYEILFERYGQEKIEQRLGHAEQTMLTELLEHGRALRAERQRAAQAKETPNLIKLIHQWGGITILYRRTMQESPAYVTNHEELAKALKEGVFYLEGLQPEKALLDDDGYIEKIVCRRRIKDEDGIWHDSDDSCMLPVRSLLVATGARLNIAYEFEHEGTFKRDGLQYQPYEWRQGELHAVAEAEHVKAADFGPFTSYHHDGRYVSFIGDSHPLFHGSVVKAIASAARTWPKITQLFDENSNQTDKVESYQPFAQRMEQLFNAEVVAVERCHQHIVELTIKAPLVAQQFEPGQFVRLQNFASAAQKINGTQLQTEALALLAFDVDPQQGILKVMVNECGASSRLCHRFQPGQALALMGPTGVRSKIPDNQSTILVLGGLLSLAYIRAVGPAWRAAGNRVIYLGAFDNASVVYCQNEIEAATDQAQFAVAHGEAVTVKREDDRAIIGNAIDLLQQLMTEEQGMALLSHVNRVTVVGDSDLLRQFRQLYEESLKSHFSPSVRLFASAYVPMQCMLKGVCSQCLQWQIDPETGQRRKAVFGCSWQDQPLELIDIDNIDQRLIQNRLSEQISQLWLDHLFEKE
ncbi:MAG: FAD-dependent oxidoreductase [Gammaproteobacteria bacterium]|nr:FAD-dependent oxidoreductase [Gammaproteobacteria bacterium]